jgi:hypothetical protein
MPLSLTSGLELTSIGHRALSDAEMPVDVRFVLDEIANKPGITYGALIAELKTESIPVYFIVPQLIRDAAVRISPSGNGRAGATTTTLFPERDTISRIRPSRNGAEEEY